MGNNVIPFGRRKGATDSESATELLDAIFRLALGRPLPLHIGWLIRPTALERQEVIDHVTGAGSRLGAGRRARVFALECPPGCRVSSDPPMAVAFA